MITSTQGKKQYKYFLIGAAVIIGILLFAQSRDLFPNQTGYLPDTGIVYDGSSYGLEEQVKMKDTFAPPSAPRGESYAAELVQQPQERMVIRSGQIWAVAENVRSFVKDITNHASSMGGFTITTQVDEYSEESGVTAIVEIRVPQERFEESMAFIKTHVLRVTSENVSGQDITEEFVDNEARLRNLEATEQQLLSIMQKAYKIEDVLAVQRELTTVRDQIERLEARQKFLKDSVAMSKISIYVSTNEQNLPVLEEKNPWQPIVVLKAAVRSLLSALQSLANAAIWIVIFLPLWGTAWLVYRFWKRKGKK